MRIGIDAHVITGKYQGTRTTLINLLKGLARQDSGHDIIVYVDDVDEAQALIGPGRFTYRPIGSGGGALARLGLRFPSLLRQDRIDIAIFQYISPPWGQTKAITFFHDILPITHPGFFPLLNRLRIRLFFALSMRRCTRAIAISDHGRSAIMDHYSLPSEKVVTIPNGPSFDHAIYVGGNVPTTPRFILAVGRIERRKNIALLVEAFLKADLADVRLIIVGSPDLGYDYRLPDDPRIENRRDVDEETLVALYRSASLFVYPSAAEGFGIPLLDALLFGNAVIASNQTAMPEIADGLARQFDPTAADARDQLSTMIWRHFTSAPIAAPSVQQRSALFDRFNWDNAAKRLLAVIDASVDREAVQ